MWRGLYTAGIGMMTQMNRTSVISNNLANAATSGFKRDRVVDEEFGPMLIRRINDDDPNGDITRIKQFHVGDTIPPVVGNLGLGAQTAEIVTDLSQGSMQDTGNQLDLASAGSGFFAVATPQGVRYTRDGSFTRAANGDIVNHRGETVLNRQGRAINIPQNATRISVGHDGTVFADGEQMGTLQLVEFDDPRAAVKEGDNHYVARPGARPRPATGSIEQGVLEMSNANVINEMVELIDNYRIYEANSRAVTTQDTMLDHSVNQVGRL